MNSTLAAEWRVLKRGKPGHRFQDSHDESRKRADRMTVVGRVIRIALAVLALGIGVVLIFIPGPAILFFLVGGALAASESRTVARVLDGMEVLLRAVFRWGKRHWRARSTPGKVVTAAIAAAIAGGFAYLGYRWLLR